MGHIIMRGVVRWRKAKQVQCSVAAALVQGKKQQQKKPRLSQIKDASIQSNCHRNRVLHQVSKDYGERRDSQALSQSSRGGQSVYQWLNT